MVRFSIIGNMLRIALGLMIRLSLEGVQNSRINCFTELIGAGKVVNSSE